MFYVTAGDISAETLTSFDKELRRRGPDLSPVPVTALISSNSNDLHEEKEPRGCVGAEKAPEVRSGPLVLTPHACRRGGRSRRVGLARRYGETWLPSPGPVFIVSARNLETDPVKTSLESCFSQEETSSINQSDIRDEKPQRCGTPPCFKGPLLNSYRAEVQRLWARNRFPSTISRGRFHLTGPSDPRAHVHFSKKKIPSH